MGEDLDTLLPPAESRPDIRRLGPIRKPVLAGGAMLLVGLGFLLAAVTGIARTNLTILGVLLVIPGCYVTYIAYQVYSARMRVEEFPFYNQDL